MINDFIVIGAGIAGASAAYEIAAQNTVLMIEAEKQTGYHSTGRSAALFTRNYGSALVRQINALSEQFFHNPPADFTEVPFLRPRGALAVAGPGDEAMLDAILAASTDNEPVVEITAQDALSMAPYLRSDRVACAVFEAGVTDIEVANLLQSYLRGFKRRGGQIVTGEPVRALKNAAGVWTVTTRAGTYQAKTLINAAGAWADEIGALAGAKRIGLVAKRRTAIIVEPPAGCAVGTLPCVDFVSSDAYIKPDGGKLMASLGDATPTAPQDVQPDEMDVAVLADWIQRETLIKISRIGHSWAGLRSFVSDDSPVIGYDPIAPDFFWHAAHGGYGIMMAPALARAVASLCQNEELPSDFISSGLMRSDFGPERLDWMNAG